MQPGEFGSLLEQIRQAASGGAPMDVVPGDTCWNVFQAHVRTHHVGSTPPLSGDVIDGRMTFRAGQLTTFLLGFTLDGIDVDPPLGCRDDTGRWEPFDDHHLSVVLASEYAQWLAQRAPARARIRHTSSANVHMQACFEILSNPYGFPNKLWRSPGGGVIAVKRNDLSDVVFGGADAAAVSAIATHYGVKHRVVDATVPWDRPVLPEPDEIVVETDGGEITVTLWTNDDERARGAARERLVGKARKLAERLTPTALDTILDAVAHELSDAIAEGRSLTDAGERSALRDALSLNGATVWPSAWTLSLSAPAVFGDASIEVQLRSNLRIEDIAVV